MKICIQGNLIIFTFSAIFTKWISRQSRAVSWLARFIKNEGESVTNLLQKFSLQKNPAGFSCKPSPLKGWRGFLIKKSGILVNSIRGNITTVFCTGKTPQILAVSGLRELVKVKVKL